MSMMRKQSILLLLMATLLAFAVALPARASSPTFSVTVPTALPIAMDADGNVSVADDAAIVNCGDGKVVLSSITITPLNCWTLCANSVEVGAAEIGSKCFALRFNGVDAAANGSVDLSGFSAIAAGESMALTYTAAITPQIESVSQTIADVVFTAAWSGHGPLTGIAVTTAPAKTRYDDGDTFDSSGMAVTATYADGTSTEVSGWTVTDGATVSEGQTGVTVSYTEDGVTQAVTVPIAVSAAIQEPVYAILYGDGELVIQRGNTPEVGRTVTKTYSGIEDTDDEPPWYAKRRSIKMVTFATTVKPLSTESWFDGCKNLTVINGIRKLDTSLATSMGYMFDTCESLTELDVSGFDVSNVTNMRYMFSDCSELTYLAVSGWNTASVKEMSGMFMNCASLTDCDVSHWDTSSVTSMQTMFSGCGKLNIPNLSRWDTSRVQSMNKLFCGCSIATTVGAEAWNTASVKSFAEMFSGCTSLIAVNLSLWETRSVTALDSMFKNCTALVSADLSGWNLVSARSAAYLFQNCESLTTLNIDGWQTPALKDINYIFYACGSLTSLDLSGLDVSALNSMSSAFGGCTSLITLDLTTWNTSSVSSMNSAFSGCSALTTIWASDCFVTPNEANAAALFTGSYALVGGNGTRCMESNCTYVYARIDRPGSPGFFTEKI